MKNIKTVTIGIPAHNEEANIGKLLDSIKIQIGKEFILEKVIVACDGCTDNTNSIVKSYSKKYKIIKLIDDGKRFGKPERLNNFYKMNTSDILIIFDADTVLGSPFVINEFAKAFKNSEIGLVGGNDTPQIPKNFVQKMAAVWIDVWYESRVDFNEGVTVNNHKGCASALSRSLCKKMEIPKEIVVGDEDYVYFKAKLLGYKFKFAKKAIVYYSVPSTVNEFFVQTTRFLNTKNDIAKYFGDWIYKEFKIPNIRKVRALFIVFIKEPFYLPIAIMFQVFQRFFEFKYKDNYRHIFVKRASSFRWSVACRLCTTMPNRV